MPDCYNQVVSLISYVKHSFDPFWFPWWALWNVFGQFKLLGQVLGRPGTLRPKKNQFEFLFSYNFTNPPY